MSFERPITIKEAVDSIHRKKYLLPAIQREFVWDSEQIERLFDSVMRDYPIGSFLFWHVDKQKSKDYQFYEFIREYHERDKTHNPKANISGDEDITAILDGQQRLTALYIGLKGSYSYKLPRKRWDNDSAFPERELYLNLLYKSNKSDLDFDFQFLTREEAQNSNDLHWFKVSNILNLQKEHEVINYLIKNKLLNISEEKAQFANETLFKLHSTIHKNEIINYYLEKDEKLDKVLNIFIRVNSGGTELNYSDLLLSIASAQWQEHDAREEITKFVDEINRIGDGFNFNKDFVLKACLVLCDFKDIAFKVDNFNKNNMLMIEKKWEKICESIKLAIKLISSFGYNRDTLTANNCIIPISYYLLKKESPSNFIQSKIYSDDRKNIRKWLAISLLKRIFGAHPDNVFRVLRQIFTDNNDKFSFYVIAEKFKGSEKSLVFNDDEIQNLFYYQYGQSYTFSTLALLFPTLDFNNKFHQDHIFPRSLFTRKRLIKNGIAQKDIDLYLQNYNYIANLQLIEGIPNIEKSNINFKEWLLKSYPDEMERKDYMKKHYIPDIDLEISNFIMFIDKREKLMFAKFKDILKI